MTNWENGKNKPLISYYPRIFSLSGYDPFKTAQDKFGDRVCAYRCTNGMSAKKFWKPYWSWEI